jgi:hypothetical protein
VRDLPKRPQPGRTARAPHEVGRCWSLDRKE